MVSNLIEVMAGLVDSDVPGVRPRKKTALQKSRARRMKKSRGRKPKHPMLVKTPRTIKLPEWLWIEIEKIGNRPITIEIALCSVYSLTPPKAKNLT